MGDSSKQSDVVGPYEKDEKPAVQGEKDLEEERLKIILSALDDLVNVNSLFTIAVFVGLSLATPGQHSLDNRPGCDADTETDKRLIVFEVVSFSCFLLSSLVAKSLKLFLNIHWKKSLRDGHRGKNLPDSDRKKDIVQNSVQQLLFKISKGGMLCLSGAGSVFGIIFLVCSMVQVIEIRLGKLACGSIHTIRATGSLMGLICVAMLIYIPLMVYAIIESMKNDEIKNSRKMSSAQEKEAQSLAQKKEALGP